LVFVVVAIYAVAAAVPEVEAPKKAEAVPNPDGEWCLAAIIVSNWVCFP